MKDTLCITVGGNLVASNLEDLKVREAREG